MHSFLRWASACALALAACAESPAIDKPREKMSQRERDSTVAVSGLPGARVVKRALDVSDAEAARVRAMDSASAP